ncbi:MAG: hypothetical protein V4488_07085 [Pseudomonadota bacterium]
MFDEPAAAKPVPWVIENAGLMQPKAALLNNPIYASSEREHHGMMLCCPKISIDVFTIIAYFVINKTSKIINKHSV